MSDEGAGVDDGFAPWDGRRVPVTLVGGYLGAGKTTVINELLARTGRPIAVLVNDLGAVNVDAALVARRHGDAIELTDGCVCCTIGNDLAEALERLRGRRTPPDHVLIELSGVAEPARVVPWASSIGFRLDGVVVLADCDQLPTLLGGPVAGPTIRAQLASADLVLLTKTDLVPPAEVDRVAALLDGLAPGVPRFRAGSPGAAAALLDVGTRRPGGVTALPTPTLFDRHRASVVPLPDPISPDDLGALVDDLDPSVLRAKGIARAADGQRWLVQVVGNRRLVTPLPHAEDQQPTDLVVITATP